MPREHNLWNDELEFFGLTPPHPAELAYERELIPGMDEVHSASSYSAHRSWCGSCERSFTDPEQTKRCPDCDTRTGLFQKPDEEAA